MARDNRCVNYLIMLVEDAKGDHMEEAYSLAQSVSTLDFNFERAVGGLILTADKKLSLKI